MRQTVVIERISSEGRDGYYLLDVSIGLNGPGQPRALQTFLVQVVHSPTGLAFHPLEGEKMGFLTFTGSHPSVRNLSRVVFQFHEGKAMTFPLDLGDAGRPRG